MRTRVFGLFILLFALMMVGCGANPVDAILKEEKAIMEELKAGKTDVKALAAKQQELAKKISNLTNDQKMEYGKRKAAEMGIN